VDNQPGGCASSHRLHFPTQWQTIIPYRVWALISTAKQVKRGHGDTMLLSVHAFPPMQDPQPEWPVRIHPVISPQAWWPLTICGLSNTRFANPGITVMRPNSTITSF
jgi:hypothetical protein